MSGARQPPHPKPCLCLGIPESILCEGDPYSICKMPPYPQEVQRPASPEVHPVSCQGPGWALPGVLLQAGATCPAHKTSSAGVFDSPVCRHSGIHLPQGSSVSGQGMPVPRGQISNAPGVREGEPLPARRIKNTVYPSPATHSQVTSSQSPFLAVSFLGRVSGLRQRALRALSSGILCKPRCAFLQASTSLCS